jgi:hypothetical protein
MRARVLHVLAPGLLDRVGQWARQYGPLPRYQGIETILARAQRDLVPARGVDAALCEQFGLIAEAGRDLPLGAIRRFGYGGVRDAGLWACADPVELRADMATVYLQDGTSLNITEDEARQLARTFATHFAGEDWRLELASPTQWHLRLPAPASLMTHPQRATIGKPIAAYLPTGDQAPFWRARLNEIQMLFHGSEINRRREARGAPPISGLWIYGIGGLPPAELLRPRATTVWSNDPLAAGLGRLAGVDIMPQPPSLATILIHPGRGSHLVMLDDMIRPAAYDEFSSWGQELESLDSQWFKPAYHAIARSDLAQCYLYDCCGRRFNLNRVRYWGLWRRPRPLDVYAPVRPSAP